MMLSVILVLLAMVLLAVGWRGRRNANCSCPARAQEAKQGDPQPLRAV